MKPVASTKAPIDTRGLGLLVAAAITLDIILLRSGGYIVWGAR